MALHHFYAYVDRKRKKRAALEMLALSGVVRPSDIELRYLMPLLKVEGQATLGQDSPAPPKAAPGFFKSFVDSIHQLIADIRSLRLNESSHPKQVLRFIHQLTEDLRSLLPYLHRAISFLGVRIGSRQHRLLVEPSTTALAVTEGNRPSALPDQASHGIVESNAGGGDTLNQWMEGKPQIQLQQALDQEGTTPIDGVRRPHRSTVATVDRPAESQNGHEHPHQVSAMRGTITVLHPRVLDLAKCFERKVLSLLTKRTQEVGSRLPDQYVEGLSTRDFDGALQNLLGDGEPLSASSLQRLKVFFQVEYDAWMKRDLSDLAIVYWWAAGVYVKAGIGDHKSALLTIVGALPTGEQIVLSCESGKPESKGSWLKLLLDLKHRGLTFPRLTVADGRLGLWAALREIHPSGETQGCWNHKITNVLNALPKEARPKASALLKAMPYAETQAECEQRRDKFVRAYRKTEGKAVETLLRDWERMVTFYGFPQEHWRHLRTTNIVLSPFRSMRLRTTASRRYERVEGAKTMMWKILRVAEKSWRKVRAPELLPSVASSVTFKDGARTQSEKTAA